MAAAAALQSDAIWLRASDYHVEAVNTRLAGRLTELKIALESGLVAFPDVNRSAFYDVALPTGRAYIHVRDDKQTVYLIAHSRQ